MNCLNLKVEAISCAGCAQDIETVLRNEDGVLDASVDFSTGSISIEYDAAETDEDRLFGVIKRIGLNVLQRR